VFVNECVLALSPTDGSAPLFDNIALVSDSAAIIKGYKLAFEQGRLYRVWGKDERGYWKVVETRDVPECTTANMMFHKTSA
jgi:hypothetical protein